eukprot:COSAG02_NODE_2581_length_8490_cov_31.587534_7_plen_264_part_00
MVTGASSGIGEAIGTALMARGMKVALVSRRSKQFSYDVSDPGEVERLKEQVEAELGVPSVVINNAGVFGPIQSIADADPAEWIETIQINTVGPYLVTRAFLAGMASQGWGRIVNVSSAASLGTPGPGNSAYATSKVALNQFTRHLAAEMVGTGVTANVIHPGDVQTEMYTKSLFPPVVTPHNGVCSAVSDVAVWMCTVEGGRTLRTRLGPKGNKWRTGWQTWLRCVSGRLRTAVISLCNRLLLCLRLVTDPIRGAIHQRRQRS